MLDVPYIMKVASMAYLPQTKEMYVESKKNVTHKASEKIFSIVENVITNDGLIISNIERSQFIQHHRQQELKREYHHNKINYSSINRLIGDGRLFNRHSRLDSQLTKSIEEIDDEQMLLLSKKI